MTRPKAPIGIDAHGKRLPHSPAEVQAIIDNALEHGELIAAIMRTAAGDVAVQVLTEAGPTQEILEILESATNAYRALVRQEQH